MDFSKYSFWELNKLSFQLKIELLKRMWWILLIIIILSIIMSYKE